ncbi:MAG TPA: ABC transporter ATP-binding protein [Opitutaceae bacterium]|nr:ABC transporter ATP-binding protein [Opitutaceae bacterium]
MLQRFKPYVPFLKPVRGTLICAVAAGLVYGAANGAGLPLMIKYVFPRVFSPGPEQFTEWQIVAVALWLPAVFTIRGIAGYLNGYLIQSAGVRILEAIRLDYFRKLQVLPLSFLQRQTTGDLISRGLADTNQLQTALTSVANDGMKQPATLLGALAFVVYVTSHEKGVGLMIACLAVIPLCVLPMRYVGTKLLRRANQLQAQMGSVTNSLSENLSAAKEVRAFGLEERQARAFSGETSSLIRFQLKVAKYDKALTPAIEIISAFGIAVVFVYAFHAKVPLQNFLSVVTALFLSYEPVKKLGAVNNDLMRGEAALDRLEVVFNEPVSIKDPPDPVPVGRVRGDVSFKSVTFEYKSGEPVLLNVSADVPAGTVCALVGPSGAGKTTFANLVPRFFDAGAGSVDIDGVDVRRMRLGDLRRNIALVSQDPVLFNDTVHNNLLLGRLDATPDEVRAAAVSANADEFIRSFPQGYDTIVGERGARLSGGQKQRLAVARAFLRNAPILILDEATSALDSQSEQMIQDALRKLVVGKTVLIIAHRFSTIRDASLILVFDRGSIVARGAHSSLYAANELYRSLYDRQRTEAV